MNLYKLVLVLLDTLKVCRSLMMAAFNQRDNSEITSAIINYEILKHVFTVKGINVLHGVFLHTGFRGNSCIQFGLICQIFSLQAGRQDVVD